MNSISPRTPMVMSMPDALSTARRVHFSSLVFMEYILPTIPTMNSAMKITSITRVAQGVNAGGYKLNQKLKVSKFCILYFSLQYNQAIGKRVSIIYEDGRALIHEPVM